MSGIVFIKEVRRFMDTITGIKVVDLDTGEEEWLTEEEYNAIKQRRNSETEDSTDKQELCEGASPDHGGAGTAG